MKYDNQLHRLLARMMRAFFYLLYQPLAWSYDLVAAIVSWGRWTNWILSALPYLEGPRILELGHGPGHLQLALSQKGTAILGIDASLQMGRLAKKRLTKQEQVPLLSCAYAQHLPFPANTFDQIAATFPTDYIYATETLSEIYRTLKPGGILVVLPTAWITGKRLTDRGTATLFRVTGQAPEWDEKWLESFSNIGFQPRAEMITRNSWSVVIILAQKPFSSQVNFH